jgi:hypothetical protein
VPTDLFIVTARKKPKETRKKNKFTFGLLIAQLLHLKEQNMRKNSTGIWALLLVGGFFAYRNRFAIQEFLEANGIKVPLLKSDLGEALQSGVAKVAGKVDYVSGSVSREIDRERGQAV